MLAPGMNAIDQAGADAPVATRAGERRRALSVAWRAFAASRLAVLAVAVLAAASLEAAGNRERFDAPGLTHPFEGLGEALLSPLAHWDAVWYLSIAFNGYGATGVDAAFFPLYPLLVRVVGAGGGPGELLVAAYVVSLAAFLGALYLLHRLVALELGAEHARATLLLLAFFPAALFFGAPYSESLFLLLSVGAFYGARTGRWAWAGALAGAASATRSAGILLLVPLALLWWRSPRRRADLAWLALAPAGLAAYSAYLGLAHGDPFAYLELQRAWERSFDGPLAGTWQGIEAAWAALGDLGDGGVAGELARRNLVDFCFLAFALVAAVGVWRRLPAAYGAYVTACLLLPLSFPVEGEPLMSLGRFVSVLFPLFMWLAVVCERRGVTAHAVVASAMLLGLLTTWFATWQWVA